MLLINYLLLVLFLNEYYEVYFIVLGIVAYGIYLQKQTFKYYFYTSLIVIIISPFLFEYFDNFIYDIYLYFNINEVYTFVGGEVSYILSFLHSFVFFLGYNRKKHL